MLDRFQLRLICLMELTTVHNIWFTDFVEILIINRILFSRLIWHHNYGATTCTVLCDWKGTGILMGNSCEFPLREMDSPPIPLREMNSLPNADITSPLVNLFPWKELEIPWEGNSRDISQIIPVPFQSNSTVLHACTVSLILCYVFLQMLLCTDQLRESFGRGKY